jgi:CheY-like chemotaxis protein
VAQRTVRVLHVEDSATQQFFLASLLKGLPEYRWAITTAPSEEAAVAVFTPGGTDFVFLDYQLAQGNGLSCLRQLRRRDALVPILAVSAVAPPEIAAELLHAGADGFIKKQELNRELLARTIPELLARTDQLRLRSREGDGARFEELKAELRQLSIPFLAAISPELVGQITAFERAARQTRANVNQLQRLFDSIVQELDANSAPGVSVRQALRPLLLEILFRLFGDATASTNAEKPA